MKTKKGRRIDLQCDFKTRVCAIPERIVNLSDKMEEMKTKATKWDGLNTHKKANAGKMQKVSYGDSDDSGWTIPLVCPVCTENVGEIMDDDGYFIMSKRCGGCGQAIQQTYTEEEIDEWYKERDQE